MWSRLRREQTAVTRMVSPKARADGSNPDVAKLADAPDLGSGGVIHVGSTPIIRTFLAVERLVSWQVNREIPISTHLINLSTY
jgi:hypothetical protein